MDISTICIRMTINMELLQIQSAMEHNIHSNMHINKCINMHLLTLAQAHKVMHARIIDGNTCPKDR